jgi:uncharacterized protein
MAANFLHGVETIEIPTGSRPISVVKSGVIGLAGIAPKGVKNSLILVSKESDAAQFGSQLPGFTIPQSLDVIFAQGAATVLVINVFDENTHTAQVTDEVKTVTDGKLKLGFAPIGTVTIKNSNNEVVSFIKGTDYSIDDFGNFKVLSTAIANGTVLKFTYKKLDLTTVTASHINGEYTANTGVRTGMKLFDLAYNLYGFNPKILIAPGFSTLAGVASELDSITTKYRAITYRDAPTYTTVNTAISGRGSGSISFNVSNKRTELLFPDLLRYDPALDGSNYFPYSAFMAGIRAATDINEGFWVSSSNKPIKAVTGVGRDLSAGISDSTSDANKLNEVGITTIFNTFGTGIRTWGNRNSSFPSNSAPDSFMNVIRTNDVVDESLEQAALEFVDKPINQALVDTIREAGNAFIRILIGRGALLPGSMIKYNRDDNSAEELAAGHITFEKIYMVPTPAERITFKSVLDISLFKNLA